MRRTMHIFVELPLNEQIDWLTVQRDKLDDQISQLIIQQQGEQEQSKHKDVKVIKYEQSQKTCGIAQREFNIVKSKYLRN